MPLEQGNQTKKERPLEYHWTHILCNTQPSPVFYFPISHIEASCIVPPPYDEAYCYSSE